MSAAENPNLANIDRPPDPLLPEDTGSALPDTAANFGDWLGTMQTEIRQLFWSVYQRTREASESFIAETTERGRRLKEERPMTLLGIIAGTAFAAGVGVAVWRSRQS